MRGQQGFHDGYEIARPVGKGNVEGLLYVGAVELRVFWSQRRQRVVLGGYGEDVFWLESQGQASLFGMPQNGLGKAMPAGPSGRGEIVESARISTLGNAKTERNTMLGNARCTGGRAVLVINHT